MLPYRFKESPSLKSALLFSLVIHLLVYGFFTHVPKFRLTKPKLNVVWVELPKGASEELDIKIRESESLPKTTIQEQKEAAKLQVDEEPEKKPLVEPKPKEKKQALRPIQPELKPKTRPKPKKKTDWEKALAELNKAKPAPPEAAQIKEKGEGFKYGTSSNPLAVAPSDPEYVVYQAKVRYKIIQEWILPLAYIEGPTPPSASIVVYINKDGAILSQEWEKKSGNSSFDASCSRAIARASPLPIPPEKLEWEAFNEGFLIQFDPSLKVQ